MPAVPPAPAGPGVPPVSSPEEGRVIAGSGARPGRETGGGVGFFLSSFLGGSRSAFFDGFGASSTGGFSIFGFGAAGGGAGSGTGAGGGGAVRRDPAERRRTA